MANAWIVPMMFAVCISFMAYYFMPFGIFLVGMLGAMSAIAGVVAIWKIGGKKYPITVHIYVDRFDGITCDSTGRGFRKRDRKTNKSFIQLVDGSKIADPGKEWEISNSGGGRILNFYTDDYTVFHPFKFTVDKEGMKAFAIPSDQRQWLADQFRINKRVTEKWDKLTKIMPFIAIIITAVACGIMFLLAGMGIGSMTGG
jgi:hypothetical protein